jgi:hypothetical protein
MRPNLEYMKTWRAGKGRKKVGHKREREVLKGAMLKPFGVESLRARVFASSVWGFQAIQSFAGLGPPDQNPSTNHT